MNDNRGSVEQLISRGHSAAWDQNWSDAASYYQQALETDPDNLKALTSLGLALFEMKEYRDSLAYYQQAAETDPEDPLPFEKITLIHERLGNPKEARDYALKAAEAFIKNQDVDKAVENWNRAIEIDPLHVRAHARLALVYQRLGRPNRAVTKYIHVASILQNAGQDRRAGEAVDRALKLAPESIKAVRAKEMIEQGTLIPLPEQFQQMPAPPPAAQPSSFQLAEPEKEEDQEDLDTNPVEEAVERSITVMAKSIFEERVLPQTGELEEKRTLDSFMEEEPAAGEDRIRDDSLMKLHVSQAIEHFSGQKWKEAADDLKSAVDAGYNHPAAFFLLGYTYLDLGRLESAERNLNRAVSHSGFDLGSRLLLGQIFREKENWEDASREYLEALRLADTSIASPEAVEDLISLYEAMIDDLQSQEDEDAYREMCNHVEQILMQPNWRDILREHRERSEVDGGTLLPAVEDLVLDRKKQVVDGHQQIHELAEEGYYGAAMEKAFFALRNAPSYLPLHITVGDLLLKQGQNEGAGAKYLAVANVYSVQGKTERALAMLKKIIDLQPMNIDVRKRYIEKLEDYGKLEDAIAEYNNLADVFYNLAELNQARETYQKALELARGYEGEIDWHKNILLRLADIDIQRLDWESALKTFREISSRYPRDMETSIHIVGLHDQLGQELLARDEMDRYLNALEPGGDPPRALQYLENLREKMPRKVDVRKRLAAFYRERGEKQKAIAELDALGDMLLDEGRTEEVIEIIEGIIALEPPNVEDYRKLLSQLN